jgi:hypothetical protein
MACNRYLFLFMVRVGEKLLKRGVGYLLGTWKIKYLGERLFRNISALLVYCRLLAHFRVYEPSILLINSFAILELSMRMMLS